MTTIFSYCKETYDDVVNNYAHPTTKHWFMIRTPIPALSLIIAYILFVKIIGPKMMQNRKPFQLKTVMIIYNAIQAILSLYIFSMCSMYGWFTRYNFICQPIILDHPDEKFLVNISWWYFMIRFLEFTDTVFFILRKKYSQVTNLHVVHHSLVPMIFWVGMLFVPTGHYTLAGYLNSLVHFFMYTYYLLAAMGPAYKKYLGWKKYMTVLQLSQFVLVLLHAINTLVSDCDVPKWMALVIIFQAALFFGMFINFYNDAFSKNKATNTAINVYTENNSMIIPKSIQIKESNVNIIEENGLSKRKDYLR